MQNICVEIDGWTFDETYNGLFPRGARVKQEVYSPSQVSDFYPFIKNDFRYLFKESNDRYPWQYLIEIACYRIGQILNIEVPPAFPAIHSESQTAGALIQWFYDDRDPNYFKYEEGGDLFSNIIEGFDRKKGKQHNIEDFLIIADTVHGKAYYEYDRHLFVSFFRVLVFDALIGNTDRHQENWGILTFRGSSFVRHKRGKNRRVFRLKKALAPAFDNGTSFGHEILDKNITRKFNNKKQIEQYVAKGTHHIKLKRDGEAVGHIELIRNLVARFPQLKEVLERVIRFDANEIFSVLNGIATANFPYTFTETRVDFMMRLILQRQEELMNLL